MSMEEKYGAIWPASLADDSANLVYERYLPEQDKVHLIFKRADGLYLPYSLVKSKQDHQWRLPFWVGENDKVLIPSLEAAKEYLAAYV